MSLDRPDAPDPYDLLPPAAVMQLTSPSFADGSALPNEHAQAGGDSAPELNWSGAPEGTKSYVITCFDPDAPTPSGFWHWVAVGIPPSVTTLPAGGELPSGAFSVRNDYGSDGFGGAAPPPGDGPHRYMFAVHALGTDDLGLDSSASCAAVNFTLLPHLLARGVLTGLYEIA
ncbi:MAG: YbhB/YbcL family Raf kinase inhibitor-like protein [Propionibacteriales bacterium]|nr:YbhB/YbcL family Raf kinase inhibitor-like protein [Propionibacteriales bacterium]